MQHQMLRPERFGKEMPCSTTLTIDHNWPESAHPALRRLDKNGLEPR